MNGASGAVVLPFRFRHAIAPAPSDLTRWPHNGERRRRSSASVAGMRLDPGQIAVVTGGASGIGLALVTEFAARGLTVVAVDVEEPVVRPPGEVVYTRLDVRSDAEVETLAGSVLARFGRRWASRCCAPVRSPPASETPRATDRPTAASHSPARPHHRPRWSTAW